MRFRIKSLAGFTMIELLVVIAVIGILAVAVLSAINPIEQINKGKDTRTRSDASELLGSIERYYSTQEIYPWGIARTGTPTWTAVNATTNVAFGDAADEFNWVSNLADSQEVKAQFAQRILSSYSTPGTPPQFVLAKAADTTSTNNQTYICFLPQSKQFKIEATRKCCASIAAGGICAAAGSLVNTAPTTAETPGLTVCGGTDGDVTDTNYICLP